MGVHFVLKTMKLLLMSRQTAGSQWPSSSAATAAAISVVASLSSPRSSTSGEQLKSAFALLLGEHVPGLFGFLFFYTPFFLLDCYRS